MSYKNNYLKEYRAAVKAGFDPALLLAGKFNVHQLHEMTLGKQHGIDTSIYTSAEISAEKMRTARMLMEMGTQVDPKMLEVYDEKQLEEIRLGEKLGLDTSMYMNPDLSSEDMKRLRLLELAQKIIEFIKEKSKDLFVSLKTRMAPVLEVDPDEVKQETLEGITLEVLKNIDFSEINTIEDLQKTVLEELELNDLEIEISDDETPVSNDNNYELINKADIDDESIALLKMNDNGKYLLVHNFIESDSNMIWDEEFVCETREIAGKLYQEALLEEIHEKMVKDKTEDKPLTEQDLEVTKLLDEIKGEMKVSEFEKVEKFINSLDKNLTQLDKLNIYLQSDAVKLTPFLPETKDLNSLASQFAQTYMKETGMELVLKEQGLYDCIDLDGYGKKMMEANQVILTDKGYYGPLDLNKYTLESAKEALRDLVNGQEAIHLSIEGESLADMQEMESKFNDAVKRYLEMDIENPMVISVSLGDKNICENITVSADNVKALHMNASLNRMSDFQDFLKNQQFDYNELLNEEVIEAEVAVSIS